MNAERMPDIPITFAEGGGSGEPPVKTAVSSPASPEPDGIKRKVYGVVSRKAFLGLTKCQREDLLVSMLAPDPYNLWEDFQFQKTYDRTIVDFTKN